MLSRILVTILLTTSALSAQNTGAAGSTATFPTIFPPPIAGFTELQQYLGLTDQQVQDLRAIQTERDKELQTLFQQSATKQNELNQLLQSNSLDYARIGQLMVEINNLQKQYPGPIEPYRSQALGLLNPPQKTKLQALADAMNLAVPADEAVQLNLLDRPNWPNRILAASDAASGTTGAVPAATLPAILTLQRK
jgi:Spy/CpxP family protein refolding chaperone